MGNILKKASPKLYGATTVGQRGQVVIPSEARRDLKIKPNTKLLVFGSPDRGGLILTKAESVTEFITMAMGALIRFEEILKADKNLNKNNE